VSSETQAKRAQVFLLQAALLSLLLGFLPGTDRVYPTAFNAHAQVVFNAALSVAMPGHHVRMDTIDPSLNADRRDTRMVGYGPQQKQRLWRQFYRTFGLGWWPTAFVAGMVLATPLPWGRRVLALLGGVALVDLLTMVRVGVMLFLNYAVTEEGGIWIKARDVAEASFTSWVPPLVIVLFSWAAVARPSSTIDLGPARRLLAGPEGSGPAQRQQRRDAAPGGVAEQGQQDSQRRAGDDDPGGGRDGSADA
jgi:hypothetical protein